MSFDAAMGQLLRDMKAGVQHGDADAATATVLDDLVRFLPAGRAAFLLFTMPLSRPAPPVCSSGWTRAALQDPDAVEALARWLSRARGAEVVVPADAAEHRRLAGWLLTSAEARDADRLVICPLHPFVNPDFRDSAVLRLVLVVACAGEVDAEAREEIEFAAWLLAHLRINREAARFAHRNRLLAAAVDQGVRQVLTRGPVSEDVRAHFQELVSRIRRLLNCDTCQLFLLPRFVSGFEDRASEDRVWLAAHDAANREGLRVLRDDVSLIAHLWCHPELSPLKVADVLYQNDYGRYGLDRVGLTRHFVGAVLRAPGSEAFLGILAARDKYGVETGGGEARTADRGFSDDDELLLAAEAAALSAVLAGQMAGSRADAGLRTRIESLRDRLSAESCELYLRVAEPAPAAAAESIELVVHARRNWSSFAVYARGEGITGQVLATGKDVLIEDGLAQWLHLDRTAQQAGRRRPGKYRVSQHLIAVMIPAPPLLPDAETLAPIGVLKVRDRLDSEGRSINARPFTTEDQHLVHAFAQMISMRIAIADYAAQRRRDEMTRHRFLTHAFRHDLVGNLIRPAILQLKHHPELPEDLRWLPAHLESAAAMFDRSWIGASLAAGVHRADRRAECDVRGVLRALFPSPDSCLFPDPDESHARLCVRLMDDKTPGPLLAHLSNRLLELAVLALPLSMYHHAAPNDRDPAVVADVSVQRTERGVRVTISLGTPATGLQWPPTETEERLAHIVSYPRLLQCPPIPVRALQAALAAHAASMTGACAADAVTIRIDLA